MPVWSFRVRLTGTGMPAMDEESISFASVELRKRCCFPACAIMSRMRGHRGLRFRVEPSLIPLPCMIRTTRTPSFPCSASTSL